jgi:hypothetical protein
MFKTSVNTVSAGSTSVAPNGEIKADMETRKMIQLFIPAVKTLYGGPEAVRCSCSGSVFSSSVVVMEGKGAVRVCWLSSDSLMDASFFVFVSVSISLPLSCPFFWEPKEAEEVSELVILGEVFVGKCGEGLFRERTHATAWHGAQQQQQRRRHICM